MLLKVTEADRTNTIIYEKDAGVGIDIMYFLESLGLKCNMVAVNDNKIRRQYITDNNRNKEYYYRKEYENFGQCQA